MNIREALKTLYGRDVLERVKSAASKVHPNPTDGQRFAGNYPKGHVFVSGLPITIETARGQRRRPHWPPLAAHYGYIRRTEGADGDKLDVFVGPHPSSQLVFLVDQIRAKSGRFDEVKVLLGFRSREEATTAYRNSYTKGMPVGSITGMTIWQFKNWLEHGDTTKRVAPQVSAYERPSGYQVQYIADSFEAYQYAKRKPAKGQTGLFDEPSPIHPKGEDQPKDPEFEALHPRESDGKFAEKDDDEPFTLQNPKPKTKPAEFDNLGGKQKNLLSGLDSLPGQQDLFEGLDSQHEEPDAIHQPDDDLTPDERAKYDEYVRVMGESGIEPRAPQLWVENYRKVRAALQAKQQPAVVEEPEPEPEPEPETEAVDEPSAPAVEEPVAPAAAPLSVKEAVRSAVEDFGEKIGGARKDTARPLGPQGKRGSKATDERPGWMRRYEVSQIAKSYNPAEVGKWVVRDARTKDWRGAPKQAIRDLFDSQEAAEAAIPLAEVRRNHGVTSIKAEQPANVDPDAAAREALHEVEANMAKIRQLNDTHALLLSKMRLTDRLKRALDAGEITQERFDEIEARGDVLDDEEHAKAKKIAGQINELQTADPKTKDGTTYAIYRKVGNGKNPIVKGGFATYEEARKHMEENPHEIIEHEFPSYEDHQYLTDVKRTGQERRKGDISPRDFQKAFGFRGGEFGKWNSGRDGQVSLNHAYDALHDLADVLGLPKAAVALNGDLAIAFGARGTGGKNAARAHYEPAKRVINLTKMKGAGTLAHEWAHALDHYIAKLAGENNYTISNGGPSTRGSQLRSELADAAKAVKKAIHHAEVEVSNEDMHAASQKFIDKHRSDAEAMLKKIERSFDPLHNPKVKPLTERQTQRWDELKAKALDGDFGKQKWIPSGTSGGRWSTDALEEMNEIYKAATGRKFYTNDRNSDGNYLRWAVKQLTEVKQSIPESSEGTTKKLKPSEYHREARELDKTRSSDYYSLPQELMARAFESYIADKLKSADLRSDYLVAKANNHHYASIGAKPYPEGDERKAINAAFDRFFSALKHEQTDDEDRPKVRLYSRSGRPQSLWTALAGLFPAKS